MSNRISLNDLATEIVNNKSLVTQADISNIPIIPSQTSNNGKFLTTDGSSMTWGIVNTDILPSYTRTEPFSLNGYYPLYTTESASNSAGNGNSHSHLLNNIVYWMPDGLAPENQYHGNYTISNLDRFLKLDSNNNLEWSDISILPNQIGSPSQIDVATDLTEEQRWGVSHGDRRYTWFIEGANFHSFNSSGPNTPNISTQVFVTPVQYMMNGDRGNWETGPQGAISAASEFQIHPTNGTHYKFHGIGWIINVSEINNMSAGNSTGIASMGDSRWGVWGSKDGATWEWLVTCSFNNSSVDTYNTTDIYIPNASFTYDHFLPALPNPMPQWTDANYTTAAWDGSTTPGATQMANHRRYKVDFKHKDYYLYYKVKHLKLGTIYTGWSEQLPTGQNWGNQMKWQKLGSPWQEIEFY